MWVKFFDRPLATGVVLVVRQSAMAKSDIKIEAKITKNQKQKIRIEKLDSNAARFAKTIKNKNRERERHKNFSYGGESGHSNEIELRLQKKKEL